MNNHNPTTVNKLLIYILNPFCFYLSIHYNCQWLAVALGFKPSVIILRLTAIAD